MEFSNFFCFRLGAITRKMTRFYNNKLSPYGLTIVQSWVLFYLSNNDGSSLKDIAAALQLDSPVVTGLIDRLMKEDLVNRQEDPSDRRSLNIFLTKRGSELMKEISPIVIEYNQRIKSIVQSEDIGAFERALAALEHEL
ncbi:MAG: MarR family winged helix-turn-helix transcriptional regulator [Candidatus Saccharibacteria bacterium]